MSRDQVIRLALPGIDVHHGNLQDMVFDGGFANPKIDTAASPEHAAVLFLNWQRTAGVPFHITLLLDSFPHHYNKIPTVIADYAFDNGTRQIYAMMPFQLGDLGVLYMDADEENINLKYRSTDASIPATTITPFTMQIKFYVMAEFGYDEP